MQIRVLLGTEPLPFSLFKPPHITEETWNIITAEDLLRARRRLYVGCGMAIKIPEQPLFMRSAASSRIGDLYGLELS